MAGWLAVYLSVHIQIHTCMHAGMHTDVHRHSSILTPAGDVGGVAGKGGGEEKSGTEFEVSTLWLGLWEWVSGFKRLRSEGMVLAFSVLFRNEVSGCWL